MICPASTSRTAPDSHTPNSRVNGAAGDIINRNASAAAKHRDGLGDKPPTSNAHGRTMPEEWRKMSAGWAREHQQRNAKRDAHNFEQVTF